MLISIWGAAFEEEEMSLGEPRSATIWNAHLAHLFRNATVWNATMRSFGIRGLVLWGSSVRPSVFTLAQIRRITHTHCTHTRITCTHKRAYTHTRCHTRVRIYAYTHYTHTRVRASYDTHHMTRCMLSYNGCCPYLHTHTAHTHARHLCMLDVVQCVCTRSLECSRSRRSKQEIRATIGCDKTVSPLNSLLLIRRVKENLRIITT